MIDLSGRDPKIGLQDRAWNLIQQLEKAVSAIHRDTTRLRTEIDRMKEMTQELQQDVCRLRQLREASSLSRRKVS